MARRNNYRGMLASMTPERAARHNAFMERVRNSKNPTRTFLGLDRRGNAFPVQTRTRRVNRNKGLSAT